MSGSLFKKQYFRYAFTILICTILLGASIIGLCTQYYKETIESDLSISAKLGASSIAEDLEQHRGMYVITENIVNKFRTISTASGSTVVFCDAEGLIRICSDERCDHINRTIPEQYLTQVTARGWTSGIGDPDGIFEGIRQYMYGVPVEYNDMVYGFVYVFTPFRALYGFLAKIGVIYLTSVAGMLLVASIIVFVETKSLVAPLTEMTRAAKAFSEGDFSKRVSVDSDDEIGELARGFNSMADSLVEMEKSRSSFVANVSHELRTPMTTIGGYIDGILDGTIPRERQTEYLNIALSEVKRLSRLTTELLNMSKIEAGEREASISVHNVWDTILNVLFSCEQRINQKNIQIAGLEPDDPAYVLCDPDMLHQVIYNLVDNAIKFTPENGEISVTVTPEDSTTKVVIRNTGDGIEPEDLPRIFDRFYKGDKSRALDRTGTGLGLYIVKTLVGIMGGEITVYSEKGSFTSFEIVLRNPETPSESEPEKEAPKKLWGKRNVAKEQ
ncbi:MAG: HAMP domain-containing histidine kinase [Oscillospiraceae bacterium]|nr:HAMP domain-containing histidine kinase [Oscillospiraceae bacterium]